MFNSSSQHHQQLTTAPSSGCLVPPFRFGYVEDGLYRAGYPKQRNFAFLRTLRLQAIVSLTPDAPTPALHSFCRDNAVQLVHIRVDKPKENIPLTYAKVCSILHVLIDQRNQPLLLHCLDGQQISGLVLVCLRKLQGWAVSSAVSEYLRFVSEDHASNEELEFIDKFAGEIEVPMAQGPELGVPEGQSRPAIPAWIWGGQVQFKRHAYPALKIKLPPELERERDAQEKEKEKAEERDDRQGLRNKLLNEILAPLPSAQQNSSADNFMPSRATVDTEGEQVSTLVRALALEGMKYRVDLHNQQ
ncbi:protein-tyrosine-phosphatase [Sorochytrium milnesiophthora]